MCRSILRAYGMCLKSSCRCGHCKALAPHYEEAATALKEKNIKLAKVNCVDEADFCQSNGIQGYPYVRLTVSQARLLFMLFCS